MATVIAGMAMSLDGYVEDAGGSADALYPDLAELRDTSYMTEMQEETGAVLMGRRTFDMAGDPDGYADTYELQVPVFVVTHRPPAVAPRRNERLFFTFVTDGVEAAVARAAEARGSAR
jgi:dihydrofolate reductase